MQPNLYLIYPPDYSPFGMRMSTRSFNSSQYRYGFNGKEKDDEIKGEGAQYDYGFRIYDPRIAKFLSVDPIAGNFPWNSPYSFAENDVIRAVDLDGLERAVVIFNDGGDGDTHISIIFDRALIETIWQELSVAKDVTWLESEWRYKHYEDGSNTNSYYPSSIENEGVLFIDATGETTTLSYEGWRDDNKANNEKASSETINTYIRIPGEVMEEVGIGLQIGGVFAAPFTGGTSLSIVMPATTLSGAGNFLQMVADFSEGNYKDLQTAILTTTITYGLSRLLGPIVKNGVEKGFKNNDEWITKYIEEKVDVMITIGAESIEASQNKASETTK